jgi:hypothetical protein
MNKTCASLCLTLLNAAAYADKYGIDEATAENGSSWGAVALVIAVLVVMYVRSKK